MKKEIILRPEELYYLGALLQAKYIDYAYVAAMGDIQQRREIYESESREGLTKKGILLEDFMGDIEVDAEAKRLLDPVYFGTLETSIDIMITAGQKRAVRNNRFHFYEGRIVSTAIAKDGIHIVEVDDSQLQTWIGGMLPPDYAARAEIVSADKINKKRISRIFSVKSNRVGEKTSVEIYVECDGRVYQEKEDGQAEVLTKEKFGLEIYRGLKGE